MEGPRRSAVEKKLKWRRESGAQTDTAGMQSCALLSERSAPTVWSTLFILAYVLLMGNCSDTVLEMSQ